MIPHTKKRGLNITRALYEEQIYNKKRSKNFLSDINSLLRSRDSIIGFHIIISLI